MLTAVLAACGGQDGASRTGAPQAPSSDQTDNALTHIHGLGVAGDDRTLLIATHVGLFVSADGTEAIERVGDTRKDLMGFSVVATDRLLASGHPAPGERLPANLGLIESRDGGRTWQPVSLLGQADFHVLRARGNRVYGFDATRRRFMASRDGGRRWSPRAVPAPILDLALDRGDPDRLIASTEAGLFASSDAGRRWRPVDQTIAGLIAWSRRDALFIVDPAGQVQTSADQGLTFRPVGTAGGEPTAFVADGGDLYVALSDGIVKRSTDGGATWSVRAAP